MIKYRLDFARKYLDDAKEIDPQNLDRLLRVVEQVINIVDEKGGV